MTGEILTWVIFAIIVVCFGIGLKHVYRNFVTGESDCCGSKGGGCQGCGGSCGNSTEDIIKKAEAKLKAENKIEALHKLQTAEKNTAKKEDL